MGLKRVRQDRLKPAFYAGWVGLANMLGADEGYPNRQPHVYTAIKLAGFLTPKQE